MQHRLRPIAQADMPLVKKWASDEKYEEYFRRYPHTMTWPSDNAAWFLNHFMIERKDDESIRGMCTVGFMDHANKSCEFGVLVVPGKERRQAAREAGDLVVDYIFDSLGFERIICRIMAYRRDLALFLLERGFVEEGTLRRNLFWKGAFHDERQFSLINGEYNGR